MSGVARAEPAEVGAPAARTMRGLFLYFLRLGSAGFGGPIALAGYMRRDLVEGRGWYSDEEYQQGRDRADDAGTAGGAAGDVARLPRARRPRGATGRAAVHRAAVSHRHRRRSAVRIIDQTQFSLLIAVVVLSAIVPTAIAQRFYSPTAVEQRDVTAPVAPAGAGLLGEEAGP